jgi:hypothetical protein
LCQRKSFWIFSYHGVREEGEERREGEKREHREGRGEKRGRGEGTEEGMRKVFGEKVKNLNIQNS